MSSSPITFPALSPVKTQVALNQALSLPVIAAPLFIISHPKMVVAQCITGIIGSFPALNARGEGALEQWLLEIKFALAAHNAQKPLIPAAPFAVNLIAHASNDRLATDLAACVKHQVPLVITSLGARTEINDAIHSYGGQVLHDIVSVEHAKKALDKGADGLIAVAAGAGGHAGALSPFALIQEIRQFFTGPLALSGCIATGDAVLAAQAMGADYAYIGSAFIATLEANASHAYKQMLVDSHAKDIVYSNLFTGVHGNYLKGSIVNAGMDPDNLAQGSLASMSFSNQNLSNAKAWKDIWGAGQGVGAVKSVQSTAQLVAQLYVEYQQAKKRLSI
jgi:nitronate monooxygenase